MRLCSKRKCIMDPWVTPAGDARILLAAENFDARTFIRTHRGLCVRAAYHHRCRRHRRGLCQPVRRGRPCPRHGDARRLCGHARGTRHSPNPDAVPARSVRTCRHLARAARGSPRPVRAWPSHSGRARGRELLSLLRAGAIDGLSIGFRTAKARIDPRTRIRRLYAVDLWEISIVTFPMLAGARVRHVKRALR